MFAARKTDNVSSAANYIEDVFSTYLYTGNGSTQTITNNIDLSGKGGLVWTKNRSPGGDHILVDTVRGVNKYLISNSAAEQDSAGPLTVLPTFTSTGYTVSDYNNVNTQSYVGWTFRKQAKFFDVVTYTGNGSVQNIPHNLGSVPGCMIVKSTSNSGQRWNVYHRAASATPQNGRLALNTVDAYFEFPAIASFSGLWNLTQPTATQFTVGNNSDTNNSGSTYVAYLFAHDAGGFGPAGTDNVISCGSFTPSSGAATVTLGYEPQFVILKNASAAEDWITLDTMRGWVATAGGERVLNPNLSAAESGGNLGNPTATGFETANLGTGTYIYIAIRRGPMRPPSSGTSVFSPNTSAGSTGTSITTNFPVDLQMAALRPGDAVNTTFSTRLTGVNTQNAAVLTPYLVSSSTAAETTGSVTRYWINSGFQIPGNFAGTDTIYWNFRRAPGFMDVVCYTGTGSNTTITHNLGATPELMSVKNRQVSAIGWIVYSAALGATERVVLNLTDAKVTTALAWNSTAPTSTVFSLGTATEVNGLAETFVAYLFATVAGVSKVGSYTGNGSSQTINCGFAAGARFILIKRTDSTGDWYVWDTARGIVSGNDPRLSLNSTAAEVTTDDSIDPDNSGFIVNQLSATNINVSSATYIYLAIA